MKNVFFLSQSGIPDPADPDYDGEKDHGTQKGVQEGDSPILDSAKVLDSLELAKPFAEERGSNPLLTLYTSNDTAHKNQQITMLVNNMGIRQWQLFDSNHTIMSLSQIAKNRVPAKTAENYKPTATIWVILSKG